MVEDSFLADSMLEGRVIPNGIDTKIFRPGDREEARTQLGLPAHDKIVVFAARNPETNPFKDFSLLEQALPRVAESHDMRITLVTMGSRGCNRMIGTVNVLAVPFVSEPERMAQYYRAADLYVHPAKAEVLPLAIIEAMACGLPVVATNVGGIPEVLVDGETGYLVEPGDVDDLVGRIGEVLGNPEQASRHMAASAVRRATESFDLERQADAYVEWYRSLNDPTQNGR